VLGELVTPRSRGPKGPSSDRAQDTPAIPLAVFLQPGRASAHLGSMTGPSDWLRNRLLLALPSATLKRLTPELEQIPCQHGQILLDADSSLEDVFPDRGVISVVAVYEDGDIIEMATIGREGCTGFQAIFGAKESSVRFLVQIPGGAAKMSPA
jgi:hypothetical protein